MASKRTSQEQKIIGIGLFLLTVVIVFYGFYYKNKPNMEFRNEALNPGTLKTQQLNRNAVQGKSQAFLDEVFSDKNSSVQLVSATTDPFGKKINMKYVLGEKSPLFIELYDLNGQRVMAWDAGKKDKGEYVLSLGVDHLESGSYHYNFIAGKELMTGTIDIQR